MAEQPKKNKGNRKASCLSSSSSGVAPAAARLVRPTRLSPVIHNLDRACGHEVDRVIHQLKVLAQLKDGDRVSTRAGVHLQRDTASTGFTRWVTGESRSTNLDAIETLFHQSFQLAETLTNRNPSDPVDVLETQQTLDRLMKQIRMSAHAVAVLTATYADDSHTTSRIAVLQDTVRDRLNLLDLRLRRLTDLERG